MREVAAHAPAFLERLPRRSRRSGVLVVEGDVVMDVVADGLDAARAGGRVAEQVPRDAGQPIGLAVSAAEQEDERLLGQIFHRVLMLGHGDRIGLARVVQHAQSADSRSRPAGATMRRAPVAEAIAVGRHRDDRVRDHPVGNDDVVGAGVMDVQHQHHRRRLRTVVDQLVSDSELQGRRRVVRQRKGAHVHLVYYWKPVDEG